MSGSALINTYGERDITLVRGDGAYVWDSEGKRYLDAVAGIAVCGLGHNHPKVTDAICQQAKTLIHCSNLYNIEPQQRLGKALIDISGMDKVFFSNSGAEANEAAIKIARKYGQERGIGSPEIITTTGSFHGRTMATLTATGNPKVKQGFAPLLSGFTHVPYNNLAAVKEVANANTVAVMVEPVQGEGGVHVPDEDYLKDLRSLCDQNNWLLIIDEIQTGNGRTGKYFACQHSNVLPDVLTTAKGLGNGVPIGACLVQGAATDILQPGNHGSTFGGNPLATNTALAVVQTLIDDGLIKHAEDMGTFLKQAFTDRLEGNTHVKDIRGLGLMLGIELDHECSDLVSKATQRHLLINIAAGNTIRLLPPLIIDQQQAQVIIDTVCELIESL
ncbi:acetylornithine transaminase [Agarilytica rhodophyticola]|uniref:acetylornithine transaminase n=1 Tax=Agarilytica rhodophyticola TaxID=1737490 RepID=UPI000B3495DA|nr:acetylornithine transaminase [Agarilytica rhodophyticola]